MLLLQNEINDDGSMTGEPQPVDGDFLEFGNEETALQNEVDDFAHFAGGVGFDHTKSGLFAGSQFLKVQWKKMGFSFSFEQRTRKR